MPAVPTGVVADDRADVRRALLAVMRGSGLRPVGEAATWPQFLALATGTAAPAVAVVNLALVGRGGLPALVRLRAAAPGCEVVLLSPFEDLRADALAAGARAFLAEDDLAGLRAVLRQVAAVRSLGTVELPSPREPKGSSRTKPAS